MPSQYLKCETCPAVYDRRPAPSTEGRHGLGVYAWSETQELYRDAHIAGWGRLNDKDYCPACAKTNLGIV